jgi:release factor glutamine methyltransferase
VNYASVVGALRGAGCVFAEDEARLLWEATDDPLRLARLVQQRVDGTPLEYLLGWVEFHGHRMAIDHDVFVPRRRTEFLVDLGLDVLARRRSRTMPVVVELCCGCGAIGAALSAALREVELHAADIDPVATRCARRNLAALDDHGRRVHTVYEGDLDAPLPARLRGRVDLLVANAPYVPTAAIELMPPEAREHEPSVALDGGSDGLAVLRRVVALAPRWLAPDGVLVVEVSSEQAPALITASEAAGLSARCESNEHRYASALVAGRAAR